MNPRFDIATGRYMSGHQFSSAFINRQPHPIIPKEKTHSNFSNVIQPKPKHKK